EDWEAVTSVVDAKDWGKVIIIDEIMDEIHDKYGGIKFSKIDCITFEKLTSYQIVKMETALSGLFLGINGCFEDGFMTTSLWYGLIRHHPDTKRFV
ncbi:hypothetical protein Tco_1384852, partial [Tanacetum coccineum]